MGQEIVYCFRCQLRLTGADIDKGKAIRAANKVCCVNCLTEPEKEALKKLREKQAQTQVRAKKSSTTSTRASATGSMPRVTSGVTRKIKKDPGATTHRSRIMRDPTASTSSRGELLMAEPRKKSNTGILIGSIAGGVVLLVLILVVALSGGDPVDPSIPGDGDPATVNGGDPDPAASGSGGNAGGNRVDPKSPREVQAKQLLQNARAFAKANPDRTAEAKRMYDDIRWKYEGTPAAAEAAEEIRRLASQLTSGFEKAIRELESELEGPLAGHKYNAAQAIIDRARRRHTHPQWTLAVDRVEDEKVEKAAIARFDQLMAASEEALGRKDLDSIRNARNEIARWGPSFNRLLERFGSSFDAVLAGGGSGGAPPRPPGPKPPGPKPPAPAVDPARSKAELKYLEPWEKAMFHASRFDFNRAGAELLVAGGGVEDDKVRAENAEDIALNEQLKETYSAMLAAMASLPAGEKVSLEATREDGSRIGVNGTVVKAGPNRLELSGSPRFVELVDLAVGPMARLYKKKADLPKERLRALAVLCTLDGDPAAAEAVLGGSRKDVPRKFWDYAATVREKLPAPDANALKNEWAARNLFYEAEADFEDPTTRGAAVGKYQRLLDTYHATGFVKRSRSEIAARMEAASETILPSILLAGGGIFKSAKVKGEFKRKELELTAWTSPKGPDAMGLQHNVEFEFYAAPGKEYKGWVLLGGCCKETFTWYLQGSELMHYDRKTRKEINCDPSGTAAAPWDHRIRASTSHGGRDHSKAEKQVERWEWAELPMPKYTSPGLKTFRLIGLNKGMAVGAVIISPKREEPYTLEELVELEKKAKAMGPAGTEKPTDWLVLGAFHTGNINETLPPDDGLKLEYDASVKKGPKKWKPVTVNPSNDNGSWKARIDFHKVGAGGSNKVSYALIHVRAPSPMKLKLHYFADDEIKFIVNGKMIKKGGKDGSTTFDVKAGWNSLLYKIKNGPGGFHVDSRITDPSDKPVQGLLFHPRGRLR